jgi:hypothetical protein
VSLPLPALVVKHASGPAFAAGAVAVGVLTESFDEEVEKVSSIKNALGVTLPQRHAFNAL